MQKDLFGLSSPEPVSGPKVGFLERHRYSFRLDQAIVLFILCLVAYVLVFSFGVETGKRYALAELKAERAKRELMIHELSERVFVRAQPEEVGRERKSFQGLEQQQPSSSSVFLSSSENAPPSSLPEKKYTIQVITLTSQRAAEVALKKFAEKGLQGFVIPSGKYLQVCVASFESREKALESLRHLKMSGMAPPDAYVRPNPLKTP